MSPEERKKEQRREGHTHVGLPPSDGGTKHNTEALCDLASLAAWLLFSHPKGSRRQKEREGREGREGEREK